MNKDNNWKNRTKDSYNNKKKFDNKQKREPISTGASVRVIDGNVEKSVRILKKILLKADRQKELAKREFYEKPSAKRKRLKNQAKKRWAKEVWDNQMKGNMPVPSPVGQKYLKTKKKRRKEFLRQEMVRKMRKRY
jgi:small subunit ribosomal protein S21|tara:strand:- start:3 stop:407 length:405 start_codon:yes stop_codon:yes gene_type:complete